MRVEYTSTVCGGILGSVTCRLKTHVSRPASVALRNRLPMIRIERAIAGDESALTELLEEQCARARRGIALKIPRALRSALDADDVLQQACVDAYRSIQRANLPDEDAFAA